MFFRLFFDPVAHHLLFATHAFDQSLNAFSQIGERRRCALAGGLATLQILNMFGEIAHATDIIFRCQIGVKIRDRRKPVFKFGVEAVLRASCLQIEKAQDERSGKAEE